MAYDAAQLLGMTQPSLDDLFLGGQAGPIPDGEAVGTAIIAPDTKYTATIAQFISHFAWQGKVFDAPRKLLKNRISVLGLEAIIAEVSVGESWMDNKPCVVLDYSKTSLVAHWIRDEIRLVAPNFYLGKVYWGKDRLIDFCLQF